MTTAIVHANDALLAVVHSNMTVAVVEVAAVIAMVAVVAGVRGAAVVAVVAVAVVVVVVDAICDDPRNGKSQIREPTTTGIVLEAPNATVQAMAITTEGSYCSAIWASH